MKRDMKVIKQILEFVEGNESSVPIEEIEVDGIVAASGKLVYHVDLCVEAGLLGKIMMRDRVQLNWQGHDYLDSLRCSAVADRGTVKASLYEFLNLRNLIQEKKERPDDGGDAPSQQK